MLFLFVCLFVCLSVSQSVSQSVGQLVSQLISPKLIHIPKWMKKWDAEELWGNISTIHIYTITSVSSQLIKHNLSFLGTGFNMWMSNGGVWLLLVVSQLTTNSLNHHQNYPTSRLKSLSANNLIHHIQPAVVTFLHLRKKWLGFSLTDISALISQQDGKYLNY